MTRNQKQNMTRHEDAMAWLSILPANIPLARGVPVITTDGEATWLVLRITASETHVIVGDDAGSDERRYPIRVLRVDLDDPQGFAYALRFYSRCWRSQNVDYYEHYERVLPGFDGVLARHLIERTTDADRLALAKAMAEVVS